MAKEKFGTLICCSGTDFKKVVDDMKNTHSLSYVDVISQPCIHSWLPGVFNDTVKKARISAEKHGSRTLVVAAPECNNKGSSKNSGHEVPLLERFNELGFFNFTSFAQSEGGVDCVSPIIIFSCIDGRTIKPIVNFIQEKFKGERTIRFTSEPGANKVFGEPVAIDKIISGVIPPCAKKPDTVIIAGHYDCAGNQVSPYRHTEQIRAGIKKIKRHGAFERVHGIWIDNKWRAREV